MAQSKTSKDAISAVTGGRYASMTAVSQATNNIFDAISEQPDEPVFIMKYGKPQAVLMSISHYNSLTGEAVVDDFSLERKLHGKK